MKHVLTGLCACAALAIPSISASAPAPDPAPAFHWKWVLTVNDQAVAIGEASDDEANGISCARPLKGTINFHYHVDDVKPKGTAPWKTHITIRSAAASITMAADADDNEDAGGADIWVDVPAKSPVVAAFGKTGQLKMTAFGHTSDSPPVPVAKAAKLVKLCGG